MEGQDAHCSAAVEGDGVVFLRRKEGGGVEDAGVGPYVELAPPSTGSTSALERAFT